MSYIRTLDIDDLNSRLEELIALRDAKQTATDELEEANAQEKNAEPEANLATAQSNYDDACAQFGESEEQELAQLEALRDEIGSKGDLIDDSNGPFVREDSWVDYCREMLEDIGDLPRNLPSYIEIDWDKTADNIKSDYSCVDWDGDTYWYRY